MEGNNERCILGPNKTIMQACAIDIYMGLHFGPSLISGISKNKIVSRRNPQTSSVYIVLCMHLTLPWAAVVIHIQTQPAK
jgi:hypothetical protein